MKIFSLLHTTHKVLSFINKKASFINMNFIYICINKPYLRYLKSLQLFIVLFSIALVFSFFINHKP